MAKLSSINKNEKRKKLAKKYAGRYSKLKAIASDESTTDLAGMTPREGLRTKEPLAQELGLTRPGVTDDEILDAMAKHPILINRPIVETDKGVRLCRPQEAVREIL